MKHASLVFDEIATRDMVFWTVRGCVIEGKCSEKAPNSFCELINKDYFLVSCRYSHARFSFMKDQVVVCPICPDKGD